MNENVQVFWTPVLPSWIRPTVARALRRMLVAHPVPVVSMDPDTFLTDDEVAAQSGERWLARERWRREFLRLIKEEERRAYVSMSASGRPQNYRAGGGVDVGGGGGVIPARAHS